MAKLKKNTTEYGRTPNVLLNDNTITLKAKGLFGYMESKPEDWEFSVNKLKYALKESADSISTGLKELEQSGYLVRRKYQNDKGHWCIEYTLHDKTLSRKTQVRDNPVQGIPPKHTKKEAPKKDIQKKENTNIAKAMGETPVTYGKEAINEVMSKWQEIVGYKLEANSKLNRYAANNLLKKHSKEAIEKMLVGVEMSQHDKYAPRISNFVDLQAKWDELKAWGKRRKSSQDERVIIL